MANVLAKIGIYGDMHLSSKNYGAHRDYPSESLEYFQAITLKTKELGLTYLIGTGDFTYGRFHSLEYRLAIEKELQEQKNYYFRGRTSWAILFFTRSYKNTL